MALPDFRDLWSRIKEWEVRGRERGASSSPAPASAQHEAPVAVVRGRVHEDRASCGSRVGGGSTRRPSMIADGAPGPGATGR